MYYLYWRLWAAPSAKASGRLPALLYFSHLAVTGLVEGAYFYSMRCQVLGIYELGYSGPYAQNLPTRGTSK